MQDPAAAAAAARACDVTGVWFDTHNAKSSPRNRFELQKTGAAWKIGVPNEWNTEVYVNVSTTPAVPAVQGTPRVANHPECGTRTASKPARAAHSGFDFFWPAHSHAPSAFQRMVPTADCQNLCFVSPSALAQNEGLPYSRSNATPAAGVCASGGGAATPAVARPWLNSSFSGLRAKGAQGSEACPLANGLCTFVVGGSLSARGEAGAIRVRSERGGSFTFLSPFPSGVVPAVAELGGGGIVACKPWKPAKKLFFLEAHETVFIFATKANATYSISGS